LEKVKKQQKCITSDHLVNTQYPLTGLPADLCPPSSICVHRSFGLQVRKLWPVSGARTLFRAPEHMWGWREEC